MHGYANKQVRKEHPAKFNNVVKMGHDELVAHNRWRGCQGDSLPLLRSSVQIPLRTCTGSWLRKFDHMCREEFVNTLPPGSPVTSHWKC